MIIMTTQGDAVIIDDCDYDKVKGYKWQTWCGGNGKTKYAIRQKNGKMVTMHRIIIGANKGEIVDHANMNGLDNRVSNLRLCTKQQNAVNMKKYKGNSKYKGVSYCSDRKKYQAGIGVNGKRISLGRYKNELDAAIAYDAAAYTYYGDFARLNTVDTMTANAYYIRTLN